MRGEDPGPPLRVHGEHVEGLRVGSFHSRRSDRHPWKRQAADTRALLAEPLHVLGGNVTRTEIPASEGGATRGKRRGDAVPSSHTPRVANAGRLVAQAVS